FSYYFCHKFNEKEITSANIEKNNIKAYFKGKKLWEKEIPNAIDCALIDIDNDKKKEIYVIVIMYSNIVIE
ncbi:MAG: hypothetical protein N3D75_04770, partial [Candidatus Aenigmarchaeota archaeon]|nr:hypothetical protein [Candidatus Aenigmarchaeota archaeon]